MSVDLSVCPQCQRDFVMPVAWEEVDAVLWEVEIVCANCGWSVVGVWDQPTVDAFDETLDRQLDAIAEDAHQVEYANMSQEADRFALALQADAILPEDFGRVS